MSSDNEIWQSYAKSVKKIDKNKQRRKHLSVPRPLAGVMHKHHALPQAARVRGGLSNKPSDVASGKSPPSVPPASGREVNAAHPLQKTFDRRIERDLRLGDIKLEAHIDLHGLTQAKAYEAFASFMAICAKRGHRYLLVITGKGRNNTGTLRMNLPQWLQSLPQAAQLLTLRPAAPKHGGNGAFYVILKRNKQS